MTTDATDYPQFPPGLWRRIVLYPGPGWIGGALEDDMHRFHLRLDHAGGRITHVSARAVRHPWSACTGAAPHISRELEGELLSDVANRDPTQHCTHLFDLAVVAAAHAHDTSPTCFDMRVADRVNERTTATLEENGVERMRWQLEGTVIRSPAKLEGFELRRLSQWKQDLPAREAEYATLLRRAMFVSGARQYTPTSDRALDGGAFRGAVCFNYQPGQVEHSTRTKDWHKDFSMSGREPLEGFDPAAEFAEMA